MAKYERFGLPINQFGYTKTVQALPNFSVREKAVLLAIAHHVGSNGDMFASQRTLARITGYSTKTVQRSLLDLEEKGLIRRLARCASAKRSLSRMVAVTIVEGQVSGLHVEAIRQHVPKHLVTMSGLNIPCEHTREEDHLWIRWVEDHILTQMGPVIDFSKTPKMISLAVISRWLFNGHKSEQFEPALIALLEATETVRTQYLRETRKLRSWKELLAMIESPSGAISSTPQDENASDQLKAAFVGTLPESLRGDFKLAYDLDQIAFSRGSSGLVLTSPTRLALERLLGTMPDYLSKHAKTIGGPISVQWRNQVLCVIE